MPKVCESGLLELSELYRALLSHLHIAQELSQTETPQPKICDFAALIGSVGGSSYLSTLLSMHLRSFTPSIWQFGDF